MRARMVAATIAGLMTTAALVTAGSGTTAAAVGDSAGAAAASPSGTIVFLKGHNIWLTRGDGSGKYQVTFDGTQASPYRSPTMSDGGIIAAGKGTDLVRLTQNGTVLNRIDPPAMTDSAGQTVDGPPVNVAISPDGSKIAYTMYSFGCPVSAECGGRSVTAVTSASRLTTPTMKSYLREPSWVTNTRLMVHGGYGSHVVLQDAAGGPQHWFDDSDVYGQENSTDLGNAALSRDGSQLAAVRGYGDDTYLITYAVSGNPRTGSVAAIADPTPLCLAGPDVKISETSWSPDGAAVVTADSSGLIVLYPGTPCESTTVASLGAGTEPFWSPAALDPALREFGLLAKPTVTGTPAVGKKLTARPGRWSPAPGSVRYAWLRNGRPIKGATGRTYLLKRADRGKRISVKVTVQRTGYQKRSAVSAAKRVR